MDGSHTLLVKDRQVSVFGCRHPERKNERERERTTNFLTNKSGNEL